VVKVESRRAAADEPCATSRIPIGPISQACIRRRHARRPRIGRGDILGEARQLLAAHQVLEPGTAGEPLDFLHDTVGEALGFTAE